MLFKCVRRVMTKSRLMLLLIVVILVMATFPVGLPADASFDNRYDKTEMRGEGISSIQPNGNTLTEAQKQKIALDFKGIGPVLGPFSRTARSETGNAANSGLSLEDSKLDAVLGKDIDWHKQPDTLDEADVVRWYGGANPKQIHLSLGNSSSEMVVMWATQDPVENEAPTVWYGLKENSLTSFAAGHSVNFYVLPEYMPNQTDFYFKGLEYHHRAVLKNLLPNTTYYYRIACDHCYNPINSFNTTPNSQEWSPSLLVYGDMGRLHKAPILDQLSKDVKLGKYDAIIHVGDFAYDLSDLGGLMGDSFFNQIEPIASKLPYLVCPGNHEMNYRQAAEHYVHRFSMPHLPWPMDKTNLWTSFDIGNVHFISYSTELFFTNRSIGEVERQRLWLDEDLTNANTKHNRGLRPWIIVYGHRPMYCSNYDRDDCTKKDSKVRNGLEDLFFQHGVDLIIEAHEHSYERLWPVYKGKVWGYNYTHPGAPVHIVSGAAGCNEQYSLCGDIIIGKKGPWSAFHTWVPGTYSYARLKVVNSSHLHWEEVLGVNGQVIDSFWLVQNRHGPFTDW